MLITEKPLTTEQLARKRRWINWRLKGGTALVLSVVGVLFYLDSEQQLGQVFAVLAMLALYVLEDDGDLAEASNHMVANLKMLEKDPIAHAYVAEVLGLNRKLTEGEVRMLLRQHAERKAKQACLHVHGIEQGDANV